MHDRLSDQRNLRALIEKDTDNETLIIVREDISACGCEKNGRTLALDAGCDKVQLSSGTFLNGWNARRRASGWRRGYGSSYLDRWRDDVAMQQRVMLRFATSTPFDATTVA